MRIRGALAILLFAACDQGAKKEPAPSTEESTGSGGQHQMLGIYPDRWTCDKLMTDADLGTALGGTATFVETQFKPPKNVPKPCNYNVVMSAGDAGVAEAWSYDLDCREDYEKRAEMLFAQYVRTSGELVEAYDKQATTNKKALTNDAGVTARRPDDASQVEVGRRALDHHGQGLLFIDDDAPCYIRVNGPTAERRLIVAKLVAERLHEVNAPMEPYIPRKK